MHRGFRGRPTARPIIITPLTEEVSGDMWGNGKAPESTFEHATEPARIEAAIRALHARLPLLTCERRDRSAIGGQLRSRQSIGWDGVSIETLVKHADREARTLSRQLREGRYRFRPLLATDIPKPNAPGSVRRINVATVRDRVVHRLMLDLLVPVALAESTPATYAYLPKRTAHRAAKRVIRSVRRGATHFFETDIAKYFDCLRHDVLLEHLKCLNLDERLVRLCYRYMRTPSVLRGDDGHQVGSDARRELGVPQGGGVSGLFAAMYLAREDRVMLKQFPGYCRYADDIVVVTQSEREARLAAKSLSNLIGPIGLDLNEDKTAIDEIARGVDFVGYRITPRSVSIRPSTVRRMKDRAVNRIRRACQNSPDFLGDIRRIVQAANTSVLGLASMPDHLFTHRERPGDVELRSFIGWFRHIDDLDQIRELDRWMRREVRRAIWRQWRRRPMRDDLGHVWCKLRIREMNVELQKLGLRTFMGQLFRIRRKAIASKSS